MANSNATRNIISIAQHQRIICAHNNMAASKMTYRAAQRRGVITTSINVTIDISKKKKKRASTVTMQNNARISVAAWRMA